MADITIDVEELRKALNKVISETISLAGRVVAGEIRDSSKLSKISEDLREQTIDHLKGHPND